jgi:hypothetical protein
MDVAPTSLEVALSTVVIDDDGANIAEPNVLHGYARQVITFGAPVHTENAGTRIANDIALIFGPVSTTIWPTIVAAAVFDDSGNMVFKGELVSPRTAPIGDTLSFGIGTLEFKIK